MITSHRMLIENSYEFVGVHNAKAEECTTPYMRRNAGVGGLHGNHGVC